MSELSREKEKTMKNEMSYDGALKDMLQTHATCLLSIRKGEHDYVEYYRIEDAVYRMAWSEDVDEAAQYTDAREAKEDALKDVEYALYNWDLESWYGNEEASEEKPPALNEEASVDNTDKDFVSDEEVTEIRTKIEEEHGA
jgi:hypothetical protein